MNITITAEDVRKLSTIAGQLDGYQLARILWHREDSEAATVAYRLLENAGWLPAGYSDDGWEAFRPPRQTDMRRIAMDNYFERVNMLPLHAAVALEFRDKRIARNAVRWINRRLPGWASLRGTTCWIRPANEIMVRDVQVAVGHMANVTWSRQ